MLAAIRNYHICLSTLQKKILLEKAIALAEDNDSTFNNTNYLSIKSNEQIITSNLTIKEVQICHNEKIVFNLAENK